MFIQVHVSPPGTGRSIARFLAEGTLAIFKRDRGDTHTVGFFLAPESEIEAHGIDQFTNRVWPRSPPRRPDSRDRIARADAGCCRSPQASNSRRVGGGAGGAAGDQLPTARPSEARRRRQRRRRRHVRSPRVAEGPRYVECRQSLEGEMLVALRPLRSMCLQPQAGWSFACSGEREWTPRTLKTHMDELRRYIEVRLIPGQEAVGRRVSR